jgi:hypothetical protein
MLLCRLSTHTSRVSHSFVHAFFHVQADLADVRTLEIPALEARHKEAAAHNRLLNRLLMFRPKRNSLTCSCVQAELAGVRTLDCRAD